MNQQHLQPLSMGQTPTLAITGFVGRPRQYRFNASKGYFTLDDGSPISKPAQQICVIPLSYRLFHAVTLFDRDDSRWVEICFLNQHGNICHLMWHQHSVKNFLRSQIPLAYDHKGICDAAWTLMPIEKTTEVEGKEKKYFMLEFSYELLDEKTAIFHDTIRAEHRLYRDYTLALGGVTELASQYWHGLKDTPIAADIIETKTLKAAIEMENAALEVAQVVEAEPVPVEVVTEKPKKSKKTKITTN